MYISYAYQSFMFTYLCLFYLKYIIYSKLNCLFDSLFVLSSIFFIIAEAYLRSLENSAEIFNSLSDIPRDIDDVEYLFKVYYLNAGTFTLCCSFTEILCEIYKLKELLLYWLNVM